MMLVDLARNDLARGDGKVSIEFLRHIQFYSHVIHMVSRVKAVLPNKADPYRLFAGTFPAGTLSGAPKIRAMQIIDELEPHSRVSYKSGNHHTQFPKSWQSSILSSRCRHRITFCPGYRIARDHQQTRCTDTGHNLCHRFWLLVLEHVYPPPHTKATDYENFSL